MQRRVAQLMSAAAIVTALAVTLPAHGSARGGEGALPALRAVSAHLDGTTSTVRIESTEPVSYVTSRPDPLTLLVDLRNVSVQGAAVGPVSGARAPVTAVHVEPATAADGTTLARVRVHVSPQARHTVRASRNLIYVEVERGEAPPAVDALAPAPAAVSSAASAQGRSATELREVRAMRRGSQLAVSLVGNGRLMAATVEAARDLPPRVLLDFEGVSGTAVPPVTTVNDGGVSRVRVGLNSRTPLVTRVVVDLVEAMPYQVESSGANGEEVVVLFGEAATPAAPPEPVAAAVAVTPAPAPIVLPPTPAVEVVYDRVEPLAAAAPVPAPAPTVAPAITRLQTAAATQPRFTGHPITLDFQGADLRAVLRTFAEISGLNVVIDPTIAGQVDVALRDVPWDQALDIILKANKLGYAVDGTVVRIAPLTVLADEEAQRRKLTDEQALSGELQVMTRALSYARAQEMTTLLTQSALSSRGQVQVDARTNTLIVRDLPDRLEAAAALIATLDRPQPQVEIEARIVQTSRDFARALGIQWGGAATASTRYGNTLPLAFPNSATLDGAVGLGVPAPNTGLGVSLGSVNGAVNLDVQLSALEQAGNARILSTPRVSTQNNVQAEITQGTQIPIQTVANNTVTVTFKDAALTLRVTPQITVAQTVIMRIELENATPDFGRAVNGIPPIDTQRALTSVLVADGETTVIGGIYVSEETASQGRTPFMSRVPLLGWLFKNQDVRERNTELLIFITPRITQG
ncbi:MAG: type IV pilus secretin PilQ [Vicinamibacterales bacterium]|nr:type IV pilus secretin PilQ [Vicinamibacterales bacterium]